MVAVIQRCVNAKVKVSNIVIAQVEQGLVILLGIMRGDSQKDADYITKKIIDLRVFNDKEGKMNLSIKKVKGSALVISQFTLCANTNKGRRPSFLNAAPTDIG